MRAILCELQRIAWGIDYYARLFLELEDFLREQISRSIFDTVLNLQEDLTGGRILPQAFIVGGLRREFSLGDFEKVKKMSLWFEQKLEDVLKGIEEDQIIQRKMRNRIKIDKSLFSEKKISGPLAQACGYLLDERAQAVEGPYRDHSVQFYRTSKKESSEVCFLDIFKSVNFQLKQSADLLKKLCMNVPKEHKLAEKQIEGSGLEKIVFSVEAPSGRMSCVLDGQKISFQSTTTELTPFLPKLLRGTYRDYVNLSLLNLGIDPGQNAV